MLQNCQVEWGWMLESAKQETVVKKQCLCRGAEQSFGLKICLLLFSIALPAAPQNVGGVATSSTSLRLHWNPPPYQHQSGRIQNYRIRIMTNTLRQFTTNRTWLDVSSLHPYSTYWCTVAAITVAQGPQSTPITVQTNQDGTS